MESDSDITKVTRRIYHDTDESDRSAYTDGPGAGDEWADIELEVLGAAEADYTIHDCKDGVRTITGLGEGPYLIRPGWMQRLGAQQPIVLHGLQMQSLRGESPRFESQATASVSLVHLRSFPTA